MPAVHADVTGRMTCSGSAAWVCMDVKVAANEMINVLTFDFSVMLSGLKAGLNYRFSAFVSMIINARMTG